MERSDGGSGGESRSSPPRFSNPLAGLSKKLSGLAAKLPENWWPVALGILILVGGFYYLQTFGMPNFSTGIGRALTFPGMPGVQLVITLASVALVADLVLGLAEAQNREDPGLLDWWIPYLVVGVLVYGQLFGTAVGWWWFVAGAAAASLLFATLWNPSDQEDPNFLDRADTTAVFRTCFILGILFLAEWTVLPYPVFVSPVLILVVGALAIFKEVMRTPKFALMVVALGLAAAIFYNPVVVFGSLAGVVIAAAFGARQGWIPGARQRQGEIPIQLMGRKMKLILAWDVVICWFAVFILTAIIIYGNPAVLVIGA